MEFKPEGELAPVLNLTEAGPIPGGNFSSAVRADLEKQKLLGWIVSHEGLCPNPSTVLMVTLCSLYPRRSTGAGKQ